MKEVIANQGVPIANRAAAARLAYDRVRVREGCKAPPLTFFFTWAYLVA